MLQKALIAIGAVVSLFLLWMGTGYLSMRATSNSLENSIIAQASFCQQQIDSVYLQISNTAKVDAQFREGMQDVFRAIFEAQSGDAAQTQTQQFLGLLATNATLSGTDWAATALEVQRVIQSGFTTIANCQGVIADKKAAYANLLGLPIGATPGQSGAWPAAMWAEWAEVPRTLNAEGPLSPRRDLDGDGRRTVFDYPSVVLSGLTASAYDTGVLPTPELYPTP